MESKYVLDISDALEKLATLDKRLDTHEEKQQRLSKLDPFKEATRSAGSYERELLDGLNVYVRFEQASKELRGGLQKISEEQKKIVKGQKELIGAARYDKVKSELAQVKQELSKVNGELQKAKKNGDEASNSLGKIGKAATAVRSAFQAFIGLQAVQYILNLGRSVFSASAQFEKYEKILQTALGSQKLASQSMDALRAIAVQTAFGLDELTEGYVKMVNRGLRPSTQEIIKLTDLAASQGKSFNQLVEAILDAQTGEFERLKEFGIRAKKEADGVTIAFKGQTAAVQNNERAIYDAFVAMGAITGVAGQNAELMSTLDGRTSNLGDSVDSLSVKLGKGLKPVFDLVLSGLSNGISVLDRIVVSFNEWIGISSKAESALSQLNEQQRITAESESILKPLLQRYDQLKDKTILNKAEQDELRKVIDEIQKIVPQAATAFDIYGRALDLNKDKVREYLEQNRSLTKEMKALARENIGNELESIGKKQQVMLREVSQGFQEVYEQGIRSERKLTNEQIVERQIALNEIKKKTIELRRALRRIDSGISSSSSAQLPTGGEAPVPPTGPTDAEKKAAEKERDRLLKLQKDFEAEKLKLEEDYGRDRLELLKDDELKYIDEKARMDKLAIEKRRETLLLMKRAFAGSNASLTGKEAGVFDSMSSEVDDRAAKERAAFINRTEKQVTETLSNEYQQRVQKIEETYNQIIKDAEESSLAEAKINELKNKKILEQEKVYAEEREAMVAHQNSIELSKAGSAVLDARITGRQRLITKALIDEKDLEIKFAQEKLTQLRSKENPTLLEQEQIEDLIKTIKELGLARQGIIKEDESRRKSQKPLDSLFEQLGFNPDQMDGFHESIGIIQNSVSELYQTLTQLSQQRIQQLDQEISKKKEQVDAEQELSEQGLANNLDLRKKELDTLKAERQKAIEEQKKMQRAQLAIDTATQISSLITATAKIWSAHSGIPFAGTALSIAATAGMWIAFAAAKAKAFQLVNSSQPDQFEFGGMVGGRRHSDGGTLIEAEEGEFVIRRNSTSKYLDLIEAINRDQKPAILDYLLNDVLNGTGIGLSESERTEMVRVSQDYQAAVRKSDDDLISEIRDLKHELREIQKGTNRIPTKQYVNAGEGKIAEISENSTIVKDMSKSKTFRRRK